jgi:tRNA pseudouridine55 synthase
MNGILNIMKPPGMTSFDVVAFLRRLTSTKKIGHTGTLDPLAAGVLPVCIGNATKAIEYLMDKDKLYRAELTLGISTDTQDSSGKIISERDVNGTDDEITEAIKSFTGRYSQIPPMYSALKVGGKKLYELAREGKTIDRNPREVMIYSVDMIRIERDKLVKILFDIHCSKGTYIRTLCNDIGEKLGCGGHMSFLLRQKSGAFLLSQSLTLEETAELADNGSLESVLISIDKVLEGFEPVKIDEMAEKKLLNGQRIPVEAKTDTDKRLVRVYGSENRFLAIGELTKSGDISILRSVKIF